MSNHHSITKLRELYPNKSPELLKWTAFVNSQPFQDEPVKRKLAISKRRADPLT